MITLGVTVLVCIICWLAVTIFFLRRDLKHAYETLESVRTSRDRLSSLSLEQSKLIDDISQTRDKLLDEVEKLRVFNSYLLGYYKTLKDKEFNDDTIKILFDA